MNHYSTLSYVIAHLETDEELTVEGNNPYFVWNMPHLHTVRLDKSTQSFMASQFYQIKLQINTPLNKPLLIHVHLFLNKCVRLHSQSSSKQEAMENEKER